VWFAVLQRGIGVLSNWCIVQLVYCPIGVLSNWCIVQLVYCPIFLGSEVFCGLRAVLPRDLALLGFICLMTLKCSGLQTVGPADSRLERCTADI